MEYSRHAPLFAASEIITEFGFVNISKGLLWYRVKKIIVVRIVCWFADFVDNVIVSLGFVAFREFHSRILINLNRVES